MIGLRFALLLALVPMFGRWIAVFPAVRTLAWSARIAGYVVAGLVTLSGLLLVMAAIGVPWTLPLLLVAGVLSLGVAAWRGRPPSETPRARGVAVLTIALAAIIVVALTTLAGAATSFDLLLFWGIKGQQFALARTIDVAFLRDPHHLLMHSDYPPLVPLLYAWTMLGGAQLDWFGTIATAPLLLLIATVAVWGFTRSAPLTALYAAAFGFLFIENNVAGNAEPMLLLFETVALATLVCAPECEIIAALALAGCVLTKVEGAVFALAILPLVGRRALRIGIAPAAALGAWIAFCASHGLLDTYRPHGGASPARIASVMKPLLAQASLDAGYVPWLAIVLLIVLGRAKAGLPAAIAALAYLTFLIVVWSGGRGDVATEIAWSARRVLVTPLVMLFFASVAALLPESRTAP